MSRLICPHCGEPGISRMRKFWMGPAVPATCQACGRKVGVSWWSMLAVIPMLVAILSVPSVDSLWISLGLVLASGALMTVIHMKWVPLVRR